jgi:CRP-like cAMP-binding protein
MTSPTLFAAHADLALNVLHGHLQERERLDQRLTALGRMSPPQRIGNLFMDVRQRLRERGLMRGSVCDSPLLRQELADAVGLSMMHLMRALRELRTRGLADLRGRNLTVLDERRLSDYSEYTASPKTRQCTLL